MQIELPGAGADVYKNASKPGEIVGDDYRKRMIIRATSCRRYNHTINVQRTKAHPNTRQSPNHNNKKNNTTQTKTSYTNPQSVECQTLAAPVPYSLAPCHDRPLASIRAATDVLGFLSLMAHGLFQISGFSLRYKVSRCMTSQEDVRKNSTDVIVSFDTLGGSNWRELSCCEHAIHQQCGVDPTRKRRSS